MSGIGARGDRTWKGDPILHTGSGVVLAVLPEAHRPRNARKREAIAFSKYTTAVVPLFTPEVTALRRTEPWPVRWEVPRSGDRGG